MANSEMALALISTLAAAVSAIGGLLATYAAFRSASLTRTTLEHAAALERRRACDAVMELVQRVTAEHARAGTVLKKLKDENMNYAGLTGTTHGSWLEKKQQDLTTIGHEVDALKQGAVERVRDHKSLSKLSDDELAELSSTLFADLARLLSIKEDLQDQLSNVREQNQLQREQVLSRVPRPGGIGK